jgi:hypothetical protein
MSSQGGLEDLLHQKYIPYVFFEHIHGIMELQFFLGASGEGLFPKAPCEGFFQKNCCQFQLSTSCKASLCKDFSV